MTDATYDLTRFVEAQELVYEQVLSELSAGLKRGHWMWFIFPQLAGLGRSATARHFAIADRGMALAYWGHPVLGARLKDCTERVLEVEGKTAHDIFGTPDDLKFCSCMTLFKRVVSDEPCFAQALLRSYDGEEDDRTLALLA